MSRDLSPPVPLVLNGQEFTLHLDMAALWDYEEATGETVADLLSPALGALQGMSTEALAAVPAADRERTGMDLLTRLLDSGAVQARKLLTLVWAMAGGPETGLEPREFGRLLSWDNRADIVAAFVSALNNGSPAPAEGDAPEAGGEADPPAGPES